MKIGVIGAGNIGATLAALLAAAGHEVMISNSRGPESLAGLVAELGPRVRAGTAPEAAVFGELVIEAIPFGRYRSLPAGELAGKILVTAANYYPARDGQIALGGRAQSELIAAYLPQTRVAKAFNTIWYQHLANQGDTSLPMDKRRVIFLAGDDVAAKAVVAGLIEQLGFGPLDTGSLAGSTVQEPGTPIYNVDLTVNEARQIVDG
ncbi:MAG: NADPH-dependent F420 reductase [Candidatus Promineifilaceae bacterium]